MTQNEAMQERVEALMRFGVLFGSAVQQVRGEFGLPAGASMQPDREEPIVDRATATRLGNYLRRKSENAKRRYQRQKADVLRAKRIGRTRTQKKVHQRVAEKGAWSAS